MTGAVGNERRACVRCGLRRVVKNSNRPVLCGECRAVEPGWPDSVVIPAPSGDGLTVCTGGNHRLGDYAGSCYGCDQLTIFDALALKEA